MIIESIPVLSSDAFFGFILRFHGSLANLENGFRLLSFVLCFLSNYQLIEIERKKTHKW